MAGCEQTTMGSSTHELLEWGERHAIQLIGMKTAYNDAGATAFACKDLHEGDVIAILPYTHILSETYAASTDIGKILLRETNVHQRCILYAVLIASRHEGTRAFHTYAASLPSTFDLTMCWPEEKLASIEGTDLAASTRSNKKWLRSEYDKMFPHLFEHYSDVFSPQYFHFEDFIWAHCAFASRAFPHRVSKPQESVLNDYDKKATGCLLPVLDLLNHKPGCKVTWERREDGIVFITRQFIASGCEVFNNYGPKSNMELLLNYGFCIADNEADTVTFRLNAACESQCKRELLQAAGLSDCDYVLRRNSAPDRRLLAYFCLHHLTDTELSAVLCEAVKMSSYQQSISQADQGARLIEFVWASACEVTRAAALSHCLLLLKSKLNHNSNLLQQPHVQSGETHIDRCIQLYLNGQAAVLRGALERIQQELESIGQGNTRKYSFGTPSSVQARAPELWSAISDTLGTSRLEEYEREVLALYLLHELHKGKHSEIQPTINALFAEIERCPLQNAPTPSAVGACVLGKRVRDGSDQTEGTGDTMKWSHPLLWSERVWEVIAPCFPYLQQRSQSLLQHLHEWHTDAMQALQSSYPKLFSRKYFKFSRFVKAYAAVCSHSAHVTTHANGSCTLLTLRAVEKRCAALTIAVNQQLSRPTTQLTAVHLTSESAESHLLAYGVLCPNVSPQHQLLSCSGHSGGVTLRLGLKCCHAVPMDCDIIIPIHLAVAGKELLQNRCNALDGSRVPNTQEYLQLQNMCKESWQTENIITKQVMGLLRLATDGI